MAKYGAAVDSFSHMLIAINDQNGIKYLPYRVAFKLNVLQNHTHLDQVPLYVLNGVYEQHKGKDHILINKIILEDIVSDIFFAIKKQNPNLDINEELSSRVLVKTIMEIFSKYTTNKINLKSAMTIITCLLCDRLRLRLGYMFQLNCDNVTGFTKSCMKNLLRDLSLLLNFLSEKSVFETTSIDSAIDSCFKKFQNPKFIDETQFMQWFMTEPPVLEWLQIFYRIKVAENVFHDVNCKICKLPIKGLRYFCLNCVNYNQCQKCFLMGSTNKKHKLKHAMQEYCWLETPQQMYTQYVKSFLGRIFGLTSNIKYLPVDAPCEITNMNQNVWDKESCTSMVSSAVKSPRQELQSVISQIEKENRLLEIEVNTLKRGDSQFEAFLNQHKSKIERQLTRLKQLKNNLSGTFSRGKMKRMQSTPLIMSRPTAETIAAVNLSPIFSDATGPSTLVEPCCGQSALSTFYGDKLNDLSIKSEVNDFSHWLGNKKTANTYNDQLLNGSYIESNPTEENQYLGNKENMGEKPDGFRCEASSSDVLANIANRQKCDSKISITVNKQSSIWLNSYGINDSKNKIDNLDDKDMEQLHSELDKILDQLQKLVT
ncbi:dystrophin-like isoform X2 [Daktulosphaira vitifoliae]|uniref:dystrophin-like isoform X2 n=1 Tax=Daktulosphaira vitifoliae TaxID=58002 RepID=UPI0021A97950|nr:dystrophin-like isoform X2 [Daktulosphaira vitifoliae]